VKIALFFLSIATLLPIFAFADVANKSLQNAKGQVAYQHGSGGQRAVALNSTVVLADRDYAITGAQSRGMVSLPDSSVVTVGSDTKVQMLFFNRTDIAHAKFVLYNGITRFEVRHPQGAKANYTFVTPTASIAVRGTQGDIGVTADSLQVNVYELCDASSPVEVLTKSGQQYTLKVGQSFVGQIVGGVLQGQVQSLTDQLIAPFEDMGIPTSAQQAKAVAESYAAGAVNSVTGGYGSEVVGAVGGLFGKKKAQPSPAPSPATTTCS